MLMMWPRPGGRISSRAASVPLTVPTVLTSSISVRTSAACSQTLPGVRGHRRCSPRRPGPGALGGRARRPPAGLGIADVQRATRRHRLQMLGSCGLDGRPVHVGQMRPSGRGPRGPGDLQAEASSGACDQCSGHRTSLFAGPLSDRGYGWAVAGVALARPKGSRSTVDCGGDEWGSQHLARGASALAAATVALACASGALASGGGVGPGGGGGGGGDQNGGGNQSGNGGGSCKTMQFGHRALERRRLRQRRRDPQLAASRRATTASRWSPASPTRHTLPSVTSSAGAAEPYRRGQRHPHRRLCARDGRAEGELVRARLLRQSHRLRTDATPGRPSASPTGTSRAGPRSSSPTGALRADPGDRPRPVRQAQPLRARLGSHPGARAEAALRGRRRDPLGADPVAGLGRGGQDRRVDLVLGQRRGVRDQASGTRPAPRGRPPRGSPRRSSRPPGPPRRGGCSGRRRTRAAPRGRRAAPPPSRRPR